MNDRQRLKKLIASPYEQEVYHYLQSVLDGATIYPKLRVADVLDLETKGMTAQERRVYMAGHFDFAVVEGMHVQFVVEVDSTFHHDHAQKQRDKAKDALCQRAGLPVLRFDLSTDIDGREIREKVREAWVETAHENAGMFVYAFKSVLGGKYSPLDLKRRVVKALVANCSDLPKVVELGERYAKAFTREGPLMGTQDIGFAMAMSTLEKEALRVAEQGTKDEGPGLFVELMVLVSEVAGLSEFAGGLLRIAGDLHHASNKTESARKWAARLREFVTRKDDVDDVTALWNGLTSEGEV